MQPISTTATTPTIPRPAHAETTGAARPGPSAVANLVLPTAEPPEATRVHGGGEPADSFVACVADMCREQPLSQVLAYIDSGTAHGPAVVADALQAVITSLPEGCAWKQLRRDCASAPAPLQFRTLRLDDPTALLDHAAALTTLARRIDRVREQGHERDGMRGFAPRAGFYLPRIAAAAEAANYLALRDDIDVLMHWPSGAIGAVRHALDQDRPVCCHDLWARYKLDHGGHVAGAARLHVWTLLIGGKDNLHALVSRGKDPATFHGPLIQALRGGRSPDAVCEDFHVTHPALREWVQAVAPLLASRQGLNASHGLPFHVGL